MKEKEQILNDLMFKNSVQFTINMLGGKLPVTFKGISAEDNLAIDAHMAESERTANQALHEYSLWVLSKAITKFGETDLTPMDDLERFNFFKGKDSTLLDKLIDHNSEFHTKIRQSLDAESIEKNFFGTPPTSLG